MNRIAIISSFLGGVRNQFLNYQDDRNLAQRMEMASRIEGVDGLELCYPADFEDFSELKNLIKRYNFSISALNFRSRRSGKWWRGSFISEQSNERKEVVDDLIRCMDFSGELGCTRITTCPLNEGSDYIFELDYTKAFDYAAETFTKICQHNSDINICIEYKKSDPMVRCIFGTAGETLSFCLLTGIPNLGVNFDIGHSLFAQERPAQAVSLLLKSKKLFYIHLNDNEGYWDWDLIPGSYHLWEFVEFFYTLKKSGYDNEWYALDVSPKEKNTVENFNVSVKLTRKLEEITDRLNTEQIEDLLKKRNSTNTIEYLYSIL